MNITVVERKIKTLRKNPLAFVVPVGLALALGMIFPDAAPFSHATDNGGGDPSIAISPVGDLIIPVNTCTGEGTSTVCTGTLDTAITVATTGSAGYTLSMNTETTNTALTSAASATIPSITASTTLANMPVNKWGYSKNSGSTYLPIPSSTASASDKLMTETSAAGTSTINFKFAAKADFSVASGQYSNKLIFSAVANPVTFYLNYDANGGSGAPGQATCSTTAATCDFTVSSTVPTRTSYDFLGWATSSSATTANYTAGDTFTTTSPTGNTLYAVWKAPTTFDQAFAAAGKSKVSGTNYYALQDMTPSICESITLLQTSTLVDTRDNNKTYSVAKLDDTNCWMTQNLTLGSSSLGKIILTSDNSDVSSNFALSAPTTTSFSTSNYDVVNYRNYTSKSSNYYNWYTATAGTGKKATATYTAATSSICPKGWRLPNGSPAANTAGEWAELLYAAGITSTLATSTTSVSYATGGKNKMTAAPYNIATTYGYFNVTDTVPTGTSYTSFWTNRVYSSANYAWSTYIGSSSATLNYGSRYKSQGLPMRCVAHRAGTQPTITYDANGGTGAPSPTTASSASEFSQSITLSSTIPTRTNYVFSGWATSASATIPEYSAGGTITTDKDMTLYAVWGRSFDYVFANAGKSKTSGYYQMQDMDSSICGAVGYGQTASLIDIRSGNEVYLVGRLNDGKCWMLDNLRLGDSSNTITLTSSDTNIASDPGTYTLPASGTANFDSTNGDTNAAINTASKNNTTTSYGFGSGKIGTYYNYCAASAGTYCYAAGSGTGNAQYDICPKGWRMPTGGSSGEYQALYTAYSSNASSFRSALSTPLSGVFNSGSADGQGSYGEFWSSAYYGGSNMYHLGVYSSSVNPTDYSYRFVGASVRCVAQ